MWEKNTVRVYGKVPRHLEEAKNYITERAGRDKIVVEVLPLKITLKAQMNIKIG